MGEVHAKGQRDARNRRKERFFGEWLRESLSEEGAKAVLVHPAIHEWQIDKLVAVFLLGDANMEELIDRCRGEAVTVVKNVRELVEAGFLVKKDRSLYVVAGWLLKE